MKKYQTIKIKDKIYILIFYKFKRRKTFFHVLNDMGDLIVENSLSFASALRACRQAYKIQEMPNITSMVDNFLEFTREE